MKILYLAPQPLYQERGTSIANKLVLEHLSKRGEQVDVLTFAEGKDIHFKGVTIHRTPDLPFLRGIRPGFSAKKIICDVFLMFQALFMGLTRRYDMVHAVEESVFIAMLLKLLYGTPYVYDMDSSLAQQMTEKFPGLRKVLSIFEFFEGQAIRYSEAVVVVCDALGDVARKQAVRKVVTLRDVPLFNEEDDSGKENLRETLGIDGKIMMYVGNLESYQGIDLLLQSFAIATKEVDDAHIVIVGGVPGDIEKYTNLAAELGTQDRVHLIGPRPIDQLSAYLQQADILLSPRIKGNNTPMKIYSYMYSGKVCLATDLWTHTQVLTDDVSVLAKPNAQAYAAGMVKLLQDDKLREKLGKAGRRLIEEKYSYDVFVDNLDHLMDWLALPQAQRA